MQALALVLVVLGGLFLKRFACLTRVQLPEKSTWFQYDVWHMFQMGT